MLPQKHGRSYAVSITHYYRKAQQMSIEDKIKNAKPTMFGFDNIPKWKLILWVYIGKIKGRYGKRKNYD